jgi:hypothetical protein
VTDSLRGAGAGAAGARALQLIRIGYGMVLVLAPGPAIRLATRRPPSPRTCRVARVLGARHLIQAALTAIAPQPAAFAMGSQVDAVHAGSMLLLAADSRAARRAALTDALTEAALAAAGWAASRPLSRLAAAGAPVRRRTRRSPRTPRLPV